MLTYIIDNSLSTDRFDRKTRYEEIKQYMDLLRTAGVNYFEVSSDILSYFPGDADLSKIILRIRSTEDIKAAQNRKPAFCVIQQEMFPYAKDTGLDFFAELAVTDKSEIRKADRLLSFIPSENIHAITFRGSFSNDLFGLRSFIMRMQTRYGKPVNLYPTNEKANAVSICMNAETFNSEYITACFGSCNRNCAELFDLIANKHVFEMRFPSLRKLDVLGMTEMMYKLIFGHPTTSMQKLRTPNQYVLSNIIDAESPHNEEIERMKFDSMYGYSDFDDDSPFQGKHKSAEFTSADEILKIIMTDSQHSKKKK